MPHIKSKSLRKLIFLVFFPLPFLFCTPIEVVANKSDLIRTEWLFVIKLEKALLLKKSDSSYQLLVGSNQVRSILAFSDRPQRKALFISPVDFVRLTHMGKNSFLVDHPNIALTFGGSITASFVVNGFKILDHQIAYELQPLSRQELPSRFDGKMVVFVDDTSSDNSFLANQRATGQRQGLNSPNPTSDSDGNTISDDKTSCQDLKEDVEGDVDSLESGLEGGADE